MTTNHLFNAIILRDMDIIKAYLSSVTLRIHKSRYVLAMLLPADERSETPADLWPTQVPSKPLQADEKRFSQHLSPPS